MEETKSKPLDFDTPLLSIKDLIHLLEINPKERANVISLIFMITTERIKIKTAADGSETLLQSFNGLADMLENKNAAVFIRWLSKKINANIESFLREQKRVFYSMDDAVDEMIKNKLIPAKLVKAMLGGKWPKHDFSFESIGAYTISEYETLVPFDGVSDPAPGPDFQLQFKMVNDPLDPLAP